MECWTAFYYEGNLTEHLNESFISYKKKHNTRWQHFRHEVYHYQVEVYLYWDLKKGATKIELTNSIKIK